MLDRIATKTEMAQLKCTVPTVGDRIGIDTWEDISLSSSSAPRTEEYKSLPITIKKYESLLTQQLKRVGKCDYFIGPGEAAVLRSKKRNHGRVPASGQDFPLPIYTGGVQKAAGSWKLEMDPAESEAWGCCNCNTINSVYHGRCRLCHIHSNSSCCRKMGPSQEAVSGSRDYLL